MEIRKLILTSVFGTALISGSYAQMAKSKNVFFDANKVYEIAYVDVIPSKAEQLNNEYFPKALEIGKKYGGRLLAGFSVKSNEGNIPANSVAIFEWEDVNARLDLLKDNKFKKIVKIRDEAVNNIELCFFKVAEDITVEFRSDKIYEIGAAKLVPDGPQKLAEYNKVAEPIKKSYGGSYPAFIVNFQVVDSKGQSTYTPHMQFIVEWGNLEDHKRLFANNDFATKAAPILMSAIDTFDPVFATFDF